MRTTVPILERLRSRLAARAVFIVDDLGDVVALDADPDIAVSDLDELAVSRLGGVGVMRRAGQSEAGALFHRMPGQDIYLTLLSRKAYSPRS